MQESPTFSKFPLLCEQLGEEKTKLKSNRYLTLLHMGGGVLKARIAFDALLDPLGVNIERWYFLTIPTYTYRSVLADKISR